MYFTFYIVSTNVRWVSCCAATSDLGKGTTSRPPGVSETLWDTSRGVSTTLLDAQRGVFDTLGTLRKLLRLRPILSDSGVETKFSCTECAERERDG